MEPDFTNYVLALFRDGELLFSSQKSRLRPLMDCLRANMGKAEGCELHDKVVGLAAARLIVHSGMINVVKTSMVSQPGKVLLEESGIEITAKEVVPIILNNDKDGPCPMEKLASEIEDNRAFFEKLNSIFY